MWRVSAAGEAVEIEAHGARFVGLEAHRRFEERAAAHGDALVLAAIDGREEQPRFLDLGRCGVVRTAIAVSHIAFDRRIGQAFDRNQDRALSRTGRVVFAVGHLEMAFQLELDGMPEGALLADAAA